MSWFHRNNSTPKEYREEDSDLEDINKLHDRAKAFNAVDDDFGRQMFNRERNKRITEVESQRNSKVVYDYGEERFYFHDPYDPQRHRKHWNGKR
jgi:hypothetical protein